MPDLEAIRARLTAASPLPWVLVPRSCKDHGDYYDLHGGRASDDPAVWWLNEIATHHDGDEGVPLDTADAEFIVHAREDIPALLAETARLNGELTEAQEKVRICEQQTARIDAENRRLRELIALGRCADCAEIAEAVDAELNDNDIDDLMRTTNDAMVHQLNDVIDVEAGLSAILTRRQNKEEKK